MTFKSFLAPTVALLFLAMVSASDSRGQSRSSRRVIRSSVRDHRGISTRGSRYRRVSPQRRNVRARPRRPSIRVEIPLPRIRVPKIRLPKVRIPKPRLPKIRLPKIRIPKPKLPKIRIPKIW